MSRVLVVVSNEILKEQVGSACEKVSLKVIAASDSRQALNIMQRAKLDLIIMAENLSPTNGEELCYRIRELSNVPIIVLCNDGDELAGARALDLGADCYMTVPLDLNELIARIRALLRRYKK